MQIAQVSTQIPDSSTVHIFLIPSWYPNKKVPHQGLFISEQIKALSAHDEAYNFSVFSWGNDEFFVPMRRPVDAISAVLRRMGATRRFQRVALVNEYLYPVLTFHHWIPAFTEWRLFRAANRAFKDSQSRSGKISIIHAHCSYPGGVIAHKLARQHNLPYLITEHSGPFPAPSLEGSKRVVRSMLTALQSATAVIAVSSALSQIVESFCSRKIRVIPNLVNESHFLLKAPLNEPFSFITIADLTFEKGLPILIEAIALCKSQGLNPHIEIVGIGPEEEQLKIRSEKLGIAELISWKGRVHPDLVSAHLKNSNCLILPSRGETFGVVLVEALMSGLPIIATDCGGPRDIVNDVNGTLIAIDDARQLADAMKNIIMNFNQYDSDLIRRQAIEKFGCAAISNELRSVYREVLK
jgi:glycosyltransferase involved in cell wall biosynthesis